MARKSRKQNRHIDIPAKVRTKSLTGIYARLSVEDNGYETRDSIENQVALLKDYIVRNSDEFQLIDLYVDNGTTGTDFEREQWSFLIEDIKAGKIDCIIIKDFSRMGRNYIEVGNYLEKVFPFLGVRIVAVNENFDSDKQSFQNSMLINSLTHIVNEYYARDISRKVTQTKRTLQKKVECVSSVCPYGYKRSESNKRKLVMDSESACVVKKIFEWRVLGKGCTAIANYLNELAIPSPGKYRYMNGNISFKRSCDTKWKSKHVAGILTNPVYLGHMVQGKTRCSYFENGGKMRLLPKDEWRIVHDTHEPLITQEQFDVAERMAGESRQRYMAQMALHADILHVDNPLSGKVFCGQCGRRLIRRSRVKKGEREYSFFCSAKQDILGADCTDTYIYEKPLMEAVTKATKQHIRSIGTSGNHQGGQKHSKSCLKDKQRKESRKRIIEENVSFLKKQKQELYTDLKEGILSLDDYEYEKRRLAEKQEEYGKQLQNIENTFLSESEINSSLKHQQQSLLSITDHGMTMDMLERSIDKIVVFSHERIEITYAFADELKKWSDVL